MFADFFYFVFRIAIMSDVTTLLLINGHGDD